MILLEFTHFCRKICFVAIYVLLCGEKFNQKLLPWRKNDKYQVCFIQCIIYTADRSQLFANLGWVSGQSTPFIKNCHLWCKVESDLFLTNVNTMLAEIKKLTMKYLVKFGLNLKTLTYSSMERKPSLSLSACSNAKQSYIRFFNLFIAIWRLEVNALQCHCNGSSGCLGCGTCAENQKICLFKNLLS